MDFWTNEYDNERDFELLYDDRNWTQQINDESNVTNGNYMCNTDDNCMCNTFYIIYEYIFLIICVSLRHY